MVSLCLILGLLHIVVRVSIKTSFRVFAWSRWVCVTSLLPEWKATLSLTQFGLMVWIFHPMVQSCRRGRWNGSHPLRKYMCVMECWRVTLPWLCCLKEVPITDVTSELLTSKTVLQDIDIFLMDNVRMETVIKASTSWLWRAFEGIGVDEDDSETSYTVDPRVDEYPVIYPIHNFIYM